MNNEKDRIEIQIRLKKLEKNSSGKKTEPQRFNSIKDKHTMEFHISGEARRKYNFSSQLFSSRGNVILADFKAARELAKKINDEHNRIGLKEFVKASHINAMGLIDEILHYVCTLYREQIDSSVMVEAVSVLQEKFGAEKVDNLLLSFIKEFPPREVY